MLSESKTRRPSSGTPGAAHALEPVATSTCRACTIRSLPSRILQRRATPSPPGSSPLKEAAPWMRGTPARCSLRTVFCVSTSAISRQSACDCDQMAGSRMPIERSVPTLRRLDTSRSALEKRPEGPPTCTLAPVPGSSSRSALRPSCAALTAAVTPVGPAPSTARSYTPAMVR